MPRTTGHIIMRVMDHGSIAIWPFLFLGFILRRDNFFVAAACRCRGTKFHVYSSSYRRLHIYIHTPIRIVLVIDAMIPNYY